MSYVAAGYTICLGALFLYAVGLVLRRRRLTRAVTVAERDDPGSERVGSATGEADR